MPGVKNSAGYFAKNGMDGIDLFIGQEGTLSVITEIEFALVKKPANIFSAFIFFRDEKDALAFSAELKTSAKGPARPPDGMTGGLMSLEYFDSNALDLLKPKRPDIPVSAQAAIFIEEEVTKEGEGPAAERLSGLITRHKALLDETWVSMNREEADKFIELRHAVPEAVNDIVRKNGFQKISTDLAVPDDKFPDMMDFYNGEFRKNGLEHVIFGHIGESHVHVNLLPRTVEDMETAKGTALAFARRAVALGGTVSAEHGIGKLKHRYLEEMYGLSGISDMVRVKKALDPNCVLGLDNIFPRESLKKA
jgi:D-lactate dehydrogenase (cytochrome)